MSSLKVTKGTINKSLSSVTKGTPNASKTKTTLKLETSVTDDSIEIFSDSTGLDSPQSESNSEFMTPPMPVDATETKLTDSYNCAPCLREDRSIDSTHYCKDCGEELCLQCVHQHKKFPTMRDHCISERQEQPDVQVRVALDTCDTHDGKVLDMFCSQHDRVLCAACVAMEHK